MDLIYLIIICIFFPQTLAIVSGTIEKESSDMISCSKTESITECNFTVTFGTNFGENPEVALSIVGLRIEGLVQKVVFQAISITNSQFTLNVQIPPTAFVTRFRIRYLAFEASTKSLIN